MLSYYRSYLKTIDNKVLKINEQLEEKYIKYKKIKAKYQIGGDGYNKALDAVSEKITQVNDTLLKLDASSKVMASYKSQITDLIAEIDNVHSLGTDDMLGGLDNAKMELMFKKLDDINNSILHILNKDAIRRHDDNTIPASIFVKPKNESWENILNIYNILLKDYKGLYADAKSMNLGEIYGKVIENIKQNSKSLDELNKTINTYEVSIRGKLHKLFNEFQTEYETNSIKLARGKPETLIKITSNIVRPLGTDYTVLNNTAKKLIDYYYDRNSINFSINLVEDDSLLDLKNSQRNKIQIGGILSKEDMVKYNVKVHEEETENIGEIKTHLTNISIQFEQVNQKMEILHDLHNEFEKNRIRYSYYLMYLMMIITKKQVTQDQEIFKYISKETIEFYYLIIKDILDAIEYAQINSSKSIEFFSTYHYFTLLKVKNLCQYLKKNLQEDEVVDIFECSSNLMADFALFNNFKDILQTYKNFVDTLPSN